MDGEWQAMQPADLPEVAALSERIHPELPEDYAVQAKRLALWPRGCKILRQDGKIMGYAFSHPIIAGNPPPLNAVPEEIDPRADEYYLHDVVVDPALRGRGLASQAIDLLLAEAQAFETAALVSVYGTAPFWERFGFTPVVIEDMAWKLAPYGEGAVFMRRLNEPKVTT